MAIKFEQYLYNIERLDQLIRLKCTGSPETLSSKLSISRSTLYRHLEIMRLIGAPITYCTKHESFVYEYPVEFNLGFSPKYRPPVRRTCYSST
ncbi:HTH domain-containing protein [Fulvivirga kasyanovii]|uniref:HTH domain-containing protein n=1 Tax=Fulvivirga kasyanovii TaxID=396812 RepID=A0ABW9RY62_9BACT|nr:HTH domain-containing protein [Fulvivirga kasyanovii]MTI28631.1 HTH domain-containing protein [Fulvivirga kasyanovii]